MPALSNRSVEGARDDATSTRQPMVSLLMRVTAVPGADQSGRGWLGPARAVVTPPHLPAKMNVFYALMHRRLVAARCGSRGDWRPDSSMQSYAPWLCSRGRGDEWPTGSNGHCGARAEANQQLAERVQVSSLAFPDDQDGPARRCQLVLVASVARNIAVEFSGPVVGTRFRSGGCRAARMLVPETAMNEQCDTTAREH